MSGKELGDVMHLDRRLGYMGEHICQTHQDGMLSICVSLYYEFDCKYLKLMNKHMTYMVKCTDICNLLLNA